MQKNLSTIHGIQPDPEVSILDSDKATLHCHRYDQGLLRIAQTYETNTAGNEIDNSRQCVHQALEQISIPGAGVLLVDLDYPIAPEYLKAQMEVVRGIRTELEVSLGRQIRSKNQIKLNLEKFTEDISRMEGENGANIRGFLQALKGKISNKEMGLILRQLGAGGMSKIYECLMDDGSDEGMIYAAKFQNAENGGLSASLLTPNLINALASATGRSRRLVTYNRSLIDRTGGKTRRVDIMELFDCSINLVQYLENYRESRVPLSLLLEKIILPILKAVRDLHDGQIVHRDPKPQNILTRQNNSPDFGDCDLRLNDFDLSCLEGFGLNSEICGTPEYMSNEQCDGKSVTRKSDIYNLGMMLFYLAGGERTIIPGAMSLSEIAQNRISQLQIPQGIKDIIAECLMGKSEDRPDIDTLIDKIKVGIQGCKQKENPDGPNMTNWHIDRTETVLPCDTQAEELKKLFLTLSPAIYPQDTALRTKTKT